MVSKTTQRISEVKAFSIFMLIASLFFQLNSFSQTITDVFPTRFTNGSKLTAIGSGFTGVVAGDIEISHAGLIYPIDPASLVIVSDTEIHFKIQASFPNPSQDELVLTVGSGSAPDFIEYVRFVDRRYWNNNNITVDEIFTNWDYNGRGYFRSSWNRISDPDDPMFNPMDPNFNTNFEETMPNNRHELIAFTINGTTYSTGVDDTRLDDPNGDGNLADAIPYIAQNYKAYSSNGVSGTPNSGTYLIMGDEIDGVPANTVLNSQVSATVYDVLIDGSTNGKGLDLGTGVSNFNDQANINFFSGNGVFGAVDDNIPDLIITQIALAAKQDLYYYTDIDGNIVGRPVRLTMGDAPNEQDIYRWKTDLYRMDTSVSYQNSLPVGTTDYDFRNIKGVRMVGLKLSDFNINSTDSNSINYIGKINNVVAQAGGKADYAFVAYNEGAFEIKSPTIDMFPLSQNICRIGDSYTISFNSQASIDNPTLPAPSPNPEVITYQWYKDFNEISGANSSSYTVSGIITASDLGNYKVRISNEYGAVDLQVTLSEGGTPTFWDGTNWTLPPAYLAAGITLVDVDAKERNLIFSEDYNEPGDLEGCDCRVLRDRDVTIGPGQTLKLYGEIIVEEDITIVDEFGTQFIPGGEITFEDDASLVQTKPVTTNENSGSINMKRDATFLNTYDYMYWSSPVTDFDIVNIPGEFPYQWSVNTPNTAGSTGDWIPASGVMKAGKGYIKRVLNDTDFTTIFMGTPNNGVVNVDVFESDAPFPADLLDRNWNLVGNPYPSALEAETFLVDNTNLEGNVQIWSRNEGIFDSVSADPFYSNDFVYNYGDQYITYNATGPSIPNSFSGKIASGQAFFVQVNPGGQGTVTFNNAMRSDSDAPDYDNGDFYRSMISESNDPTPEKQLIWIGLINEDNSSSMALVGYVDGATNGVDRMYDAHRNGDNMNIYSLVDDTKMTIQGRSYPFENSDTVALGVDLLEDGIYKIAIDHVQGSVFENETQGVYLEDTYLNVIHDLRASPYSFAGIAGTTQDRFVLRYSTDQQLSVADQNSLDTFIYIKEGRLYVKASNNIKSIVLYDVTGKQVVTYNLGANVSRSFNTQFQYPRGAYIGVINLDNNVAIAKKLIN